MSDTYDTLVDRSVRHRIALSRYSNHVIRQMLTVLRETEARVAGQIQTAEVDSYASARLTILLEQVRTTMRQGYDVIDSRVTRALDDMVEQESRFAASMVSQTGAHITISDIPGVSQMIAAAKARPFQGKLLRDWLTDLSDNATQRVRGAIRQGFVEGQSPAAIARTIRGTRALRYKDGLMDISRRGAETMVRTAVTHYAAVASNETYQAFGDLVTAVRWCSVLDSRTSLTCIGLNGRIFPVGKGPRPPAHLNCRSVLVPEIKGVESTPFPSYDDWLKRQTGAAQDDVLGPARAKLWRSGDVPLDGFTDRRGKVLTLAQLAAH